MMAGRLLATLSAALCVVGQQIPDYVNTYAPLVYLDQNEVWYPSDIQAQLDNSSPTINFQNLTNIPSPLTLSNLNQVTANCTSFALCPVYLSSKIDPNTYPAWLHGVQPSSNGTTVGAKSAAVIVNDHGDGTVDAYYMFFYAFNYGLTVLGQLFGNHVGDWEHVMIRFVNASPSTMFYSAHDAGNTYTFSTVSKNGVRPIVYSAIGSHANYAFPGTHTRNIASLALNDYTSQGPLWDPIANAYYYTYQPSSSGPAGATYSRDSTGPITAINNAPTAWLDFYGHWGDQGFPTNDTRQVSIVGQSKWEGGPTGPRDKVLQRNETCPNPTCVTETVLPTASGTSIPVTVSRTGLAGGVGATSGAGAGGASLTTLTGASSTMAASSVRSLTTLTGASSTAGSVRTGSSTAAAAGRARETGLAMVGAGLLAALL